VGLRRGQSALDPSDQALLTDFARQIGAAADVALLSRHLRRSRERLVAAREEERRRIRRDLHDGLGPALAGLALTVGAARRAAERGGPAAVPLLNRAETDAQNALSDVRRISHDLRPAALDELGLIEALNQHADAVSASGHVLVEVDADPLPALPAAVEVAAYRIVMEAVTNVARHAQATRCEVRLEAGDMLTLEVADDGVGLPTQRGTGIGLGSMRERAAELGGTCSVQTSAESGTTVRVCLPLVVAV
jgi:two-component system NarL family sensor kinase